MTYLRFRVGLRILETDNVVNEKVLIFLGTQCCMVVQHHAIGWYPPPSPVPSPQPASQRNRNVCERALKLGNKVV